MDIHHGNLVHHDHITLQRILLISGKTPFRHGLILTAGQLQHSMDRSCLPACSFTHPLGSPSRRCRQQHIHLLLLKVMDNGLDGGRLSCTGSSGENQ